MKFVKYSSDNCPTCKKLAKILEELKIDVESIILNMPDDIDRARANNITCFPTLIKYEDDVEVDRMLGLYPIKDIKEFLGVE